MPSRRSLARTLVFVVAALAVAGTTPAPTRPPQLHHDASGVLTLTAEEPMMSVDVTVTANAALLGDPTNSTTVSVTRVGGSSGGTDEPVAVMAIETVGAPNVTDAVGTGTSFSEGLTKACAIGAACTRTYRISAALAEPTGSVEVGWRVVAESRTGTDASPGLPPPGAELTVEAGAATAVAHGSLAATVGSSGIRVDPSQPRFVRVVTVVQPSDPGVGVTLGLKAKVDAPGAANPARVAGVHVASIDGKSIGLLGYGHGLVEDVHLPACTEPDGCRTNLLVFGQWFGGPSDTSATVDWTLAASAMRLGGDKPIVGTLKLEARDVAVLPARPFGSTTGTVQTGGKKLQAREIQISFDRSAVDGEREGEGADLPSGLAVVGTLRARTTSRSGSTTDVLFHLGDAFEAEPAGRVVGIASETIPVTCAGTTCRAALRLDAWDYEVPDGDVTVDWTIDTSLVLDPGVTVRRDATPSFTVVDRTY